MYSFLGKQSDSNLSVFEAISHVSSSASHRPRWPYANLFSSLVSSSPRAEGKTGVLDNPNSHH